MGRAVKISMALPRMTRAYWEAREQWSAKHPDADDLFDVGGPDTPFHPELI